MEKLRTLGKAVAGITLFVLVLPLGMLYLWARRRDLKEKSMKTRYI